MWAIEPRSFASTSASIDRGEMTRSMNQIEEQVANASSSVTLNVMRLARSARTAGFESSVGRSNALRARSKRRSQPLASASASAPEASSADSAASERRRSRSVGASSSGHVSAESARRLVQRVTSEGSKSPRTSCQNGLACRGAPSSVAASRTSVRRRDGRVHAA